MAEKSPQLFDFIKDNSVIFESYFKGGDNVLIKLKEKDDLENKFSDNKPITLEEKSVIHKRDEKDMKYVKKAE